MSLSPTIAERLSRARADLRMGVPVVLVSNAGTALAIAAETLSAERLAALRGLGGDLVLAITGRRAETLKARAYDGDTARLLIPADAPLDWVRAVADPSDDLRVPMKGPFRSQRDGSAEVHRVAIALAKTAHLLPAVVVLELSGAAAVPLDGLTVVSVHEAAPWLARSAPLHPVVTGRLPMAATTAGRVHVFRGDDGSAEHYAIEIGTPDRAGAVLTRLHSACFTGDVLGSQKCDCGPQLHAALAKMGAEGSGILLYLNQEGRGIGLANKMRAYSLQDQGFDTVEANHRLGFEDDERDFRIGAEILRQMHVGRIRLLTNNPAKVRMMQSNGIEVVERVALKAGHTALNAGYLATKAAKSGHLL